MAMDEAERSFGLSFDERKHKEDTKKRVATMPKTNKQIDRVSIDYAAMNAATHEMEITKAMREIVESFPPPDGYTYILPSPNEGKRLLIHGWIYPAEAANMAWKIWQGEATVDDFPEMTEIDLL